MGMLISRRWPAQYCTNVIQMLCLVGSVCSAESCQDVIKRLRNTSQWFTKKKYTLSPPNEDLHLDMEGEQSLTCNVIK